MNRILTSTVLAAGLALGAGAAANAGDFDGFYLGLYGSGDFGTTPTTYGFGGNAGYNFEYAQGSYIGLEADVYKPTGGAPAIITGAARLGYDFGSPFMLYGSVGAGMDTAGTAQYLLGVGAQYNVAGGFGLRAGVDRYQDFNNSPANYVVKVGVNYSF